MRFLRSPRRQLLRAWRVAGPLSDLLFHLAETFVAIGDELDDISWTALGEQLFDFSRRLRR